MKEIFDTLLPSEIIVTFVGMSYSTFEFQTYIIFDGNDLINDYQSTTFLHVDII